MTTDLIKLRELAEVATPGPWIAGDDEDSDYFLVGPHDGDEIVYQPVVKLHAQNNAEYIAAANPAKVIELLDALEALGREVAELKLRAGNGYSRKIEELIAERDTLRAELAAIRAQEPVAEFAEDFIFNLRKQPNGERWPVGTKLYVSPAAKDAGLVAVMQEAADRLEGIKGGSVSETIAMMRKALSKIGGV